MSNNHITTRFSYAIHPGEILADILEEHNLSQKDLAIRTDVTPKHINEIIKLKSSISPDFGQRLDFVFNTSPGYWNNLQNNYESINARLAIDKQYELEKSLLSTFTCYKDLAKHSYVKPTADRKTKYIELLNFFGVSSLRLISSTYAAQYRKSNDKPNDACIAAWLRIGETHFKFSRPLVTYDEKKFKNNIKLIRELTTKPIANASKRLEELCAEAGVSIVFTPYLSNTYTNGVTRWPSKDNPLIQLSIRNRMSDIFWFSFFHEAAHILLHSKKNTYVEWDGEHSSNPEEIEANSFAANILIPQKDYDKFTEANEFGNLKIRLFAQSIGVGKDIIAGRLAKDNYITWNQASLLRDKLIVKNTP
jgi:HTH-type transcriptional regulator/antitoxin HigA